MQGFVYYEGPSQIDGQPVVALMVGLKNGSVNTKTGPLVQSYFLHPRLSPREAARRGDDERICGDCRHRGRIIRTAEGYKNVGRSCYVTLYQGPRVVYEAYRKGQYPTVSPRRAADLLEDRVVRLGAYGDPASIPSTTIETVMAKTRGHTGYTHAWKSREELARWLMASCDTPDERDEAKALGFRTFRVRTRDETPETGEGQCPASHELGAATTCLRCRLCDGQSSGRRGDITLLVHGAGFRHFERGREGESAA